ncbi:hypothetical protein BJF78_21150 [Pseudonocardia sp. CNS-139]|nr:hypothetical protein BJF78_21150 [Pseudonocardia sp. CNS-139]
MTATSAAGAAASATRSPSSVSATVGAAVSTRPERQEIRFAWCSTSSRSTSPGTAPASRFSASVVLRVNTTTSPARAPTNRATVSRACSSTAVQTCDA